MLFMFLDNVIFDKIFYYFILFLILCYFIDRKDLSDFLLWYMVCKVMIFDDLFVIVVV